MTTELPQTIQYSVIPANSFQGKTTISEPKADYKKFLQSWVQSQDKHWPQDLLTADFLSKNIKCNYAAHWIVSASASGSWSASIGVDQKRIGICDNCKGKGGWYDMYKEWHNCPTCGTSGRVENTVTLWNSQSGVANGSVNSKVIENVAKDINIRCGKRDFKAEEAMLPIPVPSDIKVFQPNSVDETAGKKIVEDLARNSLNRDADSCASRMGRVRDLRIGYVNIEKVSVRHWLYPIFVGTYEFEGKSHLIQVDGITGKVFVETPPSISSARWNETLKFIGILLGIIIAGFLIFYVIDALK